MDGTYGGIHWMQHHSTQHPPLVIVSGRNGVGDMKTAGQLVIDPNPPCEEDLMARTTASSHYIVSEHEADGAVNIDQIAAENLIFMARDGQMVAAMLNHDIVNENDAVVELDTDGEEMDCGDGAMRHAALIQQHEDAGGGVYIVEEFDTTPQMVTEEVITDDWVQHQGEERVEIPAEQLSSNSQVLIDIEVPLPTVEDEYTTLRPYPCDFCSRRFRKKASLMNHMVAHQNDRSNLCKLCGSRFVRRQDLINHLNAHAEEASKKHQIADFMNFDNEDNNQASSQCTANDSFFEHDWSVPEDSVTIPSKSSRRHQQQELQQITSISNNPPVTMIGSSTMMTTTASTSAPSRGRISRLKPKEDSYVVNIGNCVNCDTMAPPPNSMYTTIAPDAKVSLPDMQANRPEILEEEAPNHPVGHDRKPFVCQECGLAFSRQKAMLSHAKTHRKDSPLECTQCNEVFWDESSLQDHQKSHQFEESNSEYDPNEGEEETQSESESEQLLYGGFYCRECGVSFHRSELLRRHSKTHAKNGNQTTLLNGSHVESGIRGQHCCSTCGETFAAALDLLAHAEVHTRSHPFKCVRCGQSFCDESTIKKHLHSVHTLEMTENSCILCGKECRDRKTLIKHAWDHSREKCHSCSKCGKNFHNKARLKRHMASHRDKSVQCDVCHEDFPDGRTLSNHRHSHSSTSAGKLFPCNECGKIFGSRSSQQIHVRIHTGERPYGCRYCWKAFADGGTLRKHERIHTGEKPYACSVCPRAFNQRVVLREHIRSHHSGLDSERGTYHCTVCGDDLSSSGDLISHLIQHSDTNTAMKRQPVTGPRKYKRRRKLKPHEIARLKRDSKKIGESGSNLDLSEFDDLLGLAEANAVTENDELQLPAGKKRKQKNSKADVLEDNNKRYKLSSFKSSRNRSSNVQMEEDDFNLDVGMDTEHDTKKMRFNSISSDKIWSTKTTNDETYKSLFSNFETTMPSLETLAVSASSNSLDVAQTATTSSKRKTIKQESTSQRTKQVQVERTKKESASSGKGRKSKSDKMIPGTKNHKGPKIIHTAKEITTYMGSGGKRRSKSIVVRSTTNNVVEMPKSVVMADDYDIISPDLQPPKQISCSPLRIKQEHNIQLMTKTNHDQLSHNRTQPAISNIRHANDLYDAHLLLEPPELRSDLEDIFRSPLKTDKLGSRQRFGSESSSQFLPEPNEEDRNIIKIEPSSPDFREIIIGASLVNTPDVVNPNTMDLGVSPPRTLPKKLMRSHGVSSSNRKYFEFADALSHVQYPKHSGSNKRTSYHLNNTSVRKNCKSARTEAAKSGKTMPQTPTSYLDYSNVDTFNSVSSSSSHPHVSSFASISAVVSAADANAAAAAQLSPLSSRKPRRYFECEMCSAVFNDRAQLLDHVPIHI